MHMHRTYPCTLEILWLTFVKYPFIWMYSCSNIYTQWPSQESRIVRRPLQQPGDHGGICGVVSANDKPHNVLIAPPS